MKKRPTFPKRQEDREERIAMEIVVDAYDSGEQAMGWYYYLEDKLQFPFLARCLKKLPVSPLAEGEEAEVTGMAPIDYCLCEMVVIVSLLGRSFGVPLAQLEAPGTDEESQQAIADWHYWIGQGYKLC